MRKRNVFTVVRPPIVGIRRWVPLALAAAAVALLAGCASDPRREMGLTWVMEQAAQRAQYEAMGFPQFTGPN